MNWINLKQNKCPQCDKDFIGGTRIDKINNDKLFTHKCGFKIRESRMGQIINSQVTAGLERKWEQELEEAQL